MIEMFGLDVQHIVELGTQVATAGALRTAETIADDMFEYIVGVAYVVYQSSPG